ncbi:VOC family protein [Fibrella arboris]|uniref:VOC family protein n=1 Tax=Fibrella arboris TaxID=3242486 RepID=UPI003522BE51
MTQINAYMHFNGNCREAMTFYQECLGGELTLLPVGESPLADQMPAALHGCILHACLKRGSLVLLGSDMGVGQEPAIGNSVSMVLNCSSEAEINRLIDQLSAGGEVVHPLENTFWGSIFGDVADQYGFHWYLNFDNVQPALATHSSIAALV